MEREKKKMKKKIIIGSMLLLSIVVFLLLIIFIKHNYITIDNIIDKMKTNKAINNNMIVSLTKTEDSKLTILDNDYIHTIKINFGDKRIEDDSLSICGIYITDNDKYAKLLKSYFDKEMQIKIQVAKENNFNADYLLENPNTTYINKNVVLLLSNNLDTSYQNEYISAFNNVVSKSIYFPINNIDKDEYARLEKNINLEIEKKLDSQKENYKEEYIELFKSQIEMVEEAIQQVEISLNIDDIKEIENVLETYQFERIEYFNEKIIEWNNKIAKVKEYVVNQINKKISDLYSTLNKEALDALKREINEMKDTYYSKHKNTWNSQIDEIYVKISNQAIQNYKNSCKSYSYKDISRNPETYKGQKACFTGKIVQVMESSYTTQLRVNVTKESYGYYTDTIYVVYSNVDSNNRFLEDDIIKIYGELDGLQSYTTVLGSTVTIPKINAKYIEVQ